MKIRFLRGILPACAVALVSLLVLVSSCDDGEDDTVPGYAVYDPEISPCLNEDGTSADEAGDGEECADSLRLAWDGEFLAVEHSCTRRNCAIDFRASYQVAGDRLYLYEADAADIASGCTCPFDASYIVPVAPGAYRFALYTMKAGGEPEHARFEDDISLPEGEEASYEY